MNNLFKKISNKVEFLVSSYQKLSKENKDLLEERKDLLQKIDALKNEIENLQQSIEKIQISASLESGDQNNLLARKKINMFLKEIDKCITMLND